MKKPTQSANHDQGEENKSKAGPDGEKNGLNKQLEAEGICELDDPGLFRKIYARLRIEKKPVGESECFLVLRLAHCQMRLRRAATLETEYLKGVLNPRVIETRADRLASDLRVIEFIQMFGNKPRVTPEDFKAVVAEFHELHKTVVKREGFVPRVSSSAVAGLSVYQRYERGVEDRFYRTQKELNLLQRERKRRGTERN